MNMTKLQNIQLGKNYTYCHMLDDVAKSSILIRREQPVEAKENI